MALRFFSPVHKATRQLEIFLEPRAQAEELTLREAHSLCYLCDYGPCPISELHRVLGVKRSTLTSLIDRLEERGLLRREANPDDRRSWQLAIERTGAAIATRLIEDGEAIEREIEKRTTAQQRAGFNAVLAAITEITQVEVRPATKSPQGKAE